MHADLEMSIVIEKGCNRTIRIWFS